MYAWIYFWTFFTVSQIIYAVKVWILASKSSYVEGLVSSWGPYWEVGPAGRKLGRWGCALEGNSGAPACFLSLLPDHHKVSSFLCRDALCYQRPKSKGTKQLWTKRSKMVSQKKSFPFLSWFFFSIFSHGQTVN